ncbi:MAG: hypothetical protein KC910_01205, partial [Candidatus Eremiobacteraeota bacterium]|nr:hypothetical protein [Candidatus Eremiobacteraeota bacterium]
TKDPNVVADEEMPDLTTGTLLVIKGTEVAFYIPPTGLEVVQGDCGNYVREAVTLERLEYCILLDEDGHKRYIQGPQVVFPRPTERFVEREGRRKFRAIELNELSGIYLKVIAPYSEDGRDYKVGEELFLTGREQMIYFPRPEHAVIRYGQREIHYAVAIPAGEARYVLDRMSGEISLVRGPRMFLPDPRKEVVVRRVLDAEEVALWFPGNQEALDYNDNLKALSGFSDYVSEKMLSPDGAPSKKKAREEALVSDGFNRSNNFTPPRTITLYDKYDGAVNIDVWTGYAIQVVRRSGQRKVLVGPTSYQLEYDETLEAVTLSTGTPKSDEQLYHTVYLRVLNNQVSDVVRADTADLCQVSVSVSYRVNFTGQPEKWFNVENYVKYLTDHLRSLLRKAIKRVGVESFYANAVDMVRDAVLGTPDESGNRPGRRFEENGMHVYDVDVLDLQVGDAAIAAMLVRAQHSTVAQAVELTRQQKTLEVTRQTETIKQAIADAVAETLEKQLALEQNEVLQRLALEKARIESAAELRNRDLETKLADQKALTELKEAELARLRSQSEQDLEFDGRRQEQRLDALRAEVQGVVDKAQAVSPDLVAALQAFGDRHLAEKMAQSMAPLAILGGESVADVLGRLLRDTPLESVVKRIPATNGAAGDH